MALKEVLNCFSKSTSLHINYHKSPMLPINVREDRMDRLAHVFGFQVGTLPFTYLGLPVGTSRPRIQDLTPIVSRLERWLCATSSFLAQGSRLQLISSVLCSMPMHFLSTLQIPPGIVGQLNRIIRQCLWRDNFDTPKQSLAAWEMICKPKMKGGLGITIFYVKNEALLIKHLHKFYNKEDLPWVNLIWASYYQHDVPHGSNLCGSFWWRDIAKLMVNIEWLLSLLLSRVIQCCFGQMNGRLEMIPLL